MKISFKKGKLNSEVFNVVEDNLSEFFAHCVEIDVIVVGLARIAGGFVTSDEYSVVDVDGIVSGVVAGVDAVEDEPADKVEVALPVVVDVAVAVGSAGQSVKQSSVGLK